MDDRPFFYRVRGRTLGPVNLRTIRRLARQAQIGRTHDISRDGLQWAKASDFPEIFESDEGDSGQGSAGQGSVSGTGSYPGPGPVVSFPDPGPGPQWFYTVNGSTQGPVDMATLQQLVANGTVPTTEHVLQEGGSQWTRVSDMPQLAGGSGISINATSRCGQCGTALPVGSAFCPQCGGTARGDGASQGLVPPGQRKSRSTAALLGFFLGNLGVHRFYLGDPGLGVLFLLTCGVCGIGSLIDSIMLIAMTDKAFDDKYNRRRRA